jgi:hypothetical protein
MNRGKFWGQEIGHKTRAGKVVGTDNEAKIILRFNLWNARHAPRTEKEIGMFTHSREL